MSLRSLSIGLLAAVATFAHADVEFGSGSILVKPKPGQSTAAHNAYKSMGATITRSVSQIGWETLRLKTGTTVQAALAKLGSNKAIAAVEPNFIRRPTDLPNDPMVPAQYSIAKMQLSAAWSIVMGTNSGTPGSKDAIVAIVDTGVDVNHPDLKAACIAGYDTADGGDTNVMGTNPHGTHCAGIAAATGNNGIGIAGIAYGASIMPVKIFPDGVDGAYSDAIAAGVIWAADHGANVISMSFGGSGLSQEESDALDYAYNKNVLLVAAAGNNNSGSLFYPAAYPKCLAVGATDSADGRASFSNYGATWVDVAAPGVNIRSTVFNNAYEDYSGTSMACPNVAGVATLLVSLAGPGSLTNEELRALIENNCDPISDPILGSWVARGRVNAYRAVLATPLPIVDAAPPTLPTPVDGSLANASAAVLDASDGISATLKAARKAGVGYSGSMTASFAMTKLALGDLRAAEVSFTMQTDRLATVQIYMLNVSTNKYVLAFAKPGAGVSQTIDQKLTKSQIAPYVATDGTVKMMVRALVPMAFVGQSQGITKIDQLQVTFSGRRNSGGTP